MARCGPSRKGGKLFTLLVLDLWLAEGPAGRPQLDPALR